MDWQNGLCASNGTSGLYRDATTSMTMCKCNTAMTPVTTTYASDATFSA